MTHALENSWVTDKNNKTKRVRAITLVAGLKLITGQYNGFNKDRKKDGKTQFRLLVTLKEGAVAQLLNSEEFEKKTITNGHIYKGGDEATSVDGNIRLKSVDGNPARLQFSYDENNLLEGDIDVDYRGYVGEGHNKPYNSDIRAVGPEEDNGTPINNLERHNQRYGKENKNPLNNLPTGPL